MIDKSVYIHSTAVVDEGASVGAGSRIWHFSHLMPGASIGASCVLGQNVYIASTVVLGDGCKVQNNVSLYDGVQCEANVFIGPSAVFTNVINPRAHVERKEEYKKTIIREGASIGANATILCGIELGAYCLVAAGAVVTSSVDAYTLVAGVPAKPIGYISAYGERLHFSQSDATAYCPATGKAYQLLNGVVRPVDA